MYVRGPSGVLLAAALVASGVAQVSEDALAHPLLMGPPVRDYPQLNTTRRPRLRDKGARRPAGSKLSRKAAKGRL